MLDDAAALTAGEPQAIAFLRAYCAPDRWTGMVEGDDWQLFGSLHLSDLRNALPAFDAALLAARQEADRVRDVHLRRHRRLAAALGLDDGYSVDATIDEAIRRAALAATPEEK